MVAQAARPTANPASATAAARQYAGAVTGALRLGGHR